ncbi:MAG TPA: hypothetical protein VMM17_06525 [Gemmatimonadaceae bacterium]|nr:hypothetical protein [Gemmatimonadaceae bacterium]
MMRTSATEAASATATLREATRRLAHQVSNAANAAAVNVEVLRSRLARGGGSAESLMAFAERAAAAMEQVSAGVAATRTLLAAMGEVAAEDSPMVRPISGDPTAVKLLVGTVMPFDEAAIRFAEAAGVGLRSTPDGVILRVLRRGAAVDAVGE